MRVDRLSAEGLTALHEASLALLADVGVGVGLPEAVERLAAAGAGVAADGDAYRVRLPADMVERCIADAPGCITYAGRDPAADFVAEPGRLGFATFGECIDLLDPTTGRRREATKADCSEVARLVDALDELAVMERTLAPGDVAPATAPLHNLEVTLRNTRKHVFLGAGSRANLDVMVEMGCAAAGGQQRFAERPLFTANVCPTSPLGLADECCDVLIGAAERGLGIMVIPMSLAGATAPVTLAGVVAQHDAEVLATLVLAQVTRPGTPVTYGCVSTIMDLRSAASAVGAPEQALIASAAAAMAAHRGLPSWVGGGISDSKTTDAQAGYEYALNAVVPALAGATIVYGAGALESGLTFDYGKLLLDCDAIAGIRRIVDGVAVTTDELAVDVIADTGPYGSYLMHDHTLRGMRDQSRPRCFDRRSAEAWRTDGAETADVRARRAAVAIIAEHEPLHLPDGAEADMAGLLRDYEAACGLGR